MSRLLEFLSDPAPGVWYSDASEGYHGETPSHECKKCGTRWSRLPRCFICGRWGTQRREAADFTTEWEIV